MIRKTLLILTLLSTLFNDAGAWAKKDAKALKILDSMHAYYQNIGTFEAAFTYTIENPQEEVKEDLKGVITVKGDKYRLRIGGQEVLNNGETTWLYLKDANEVSVNNYNPEEDSNPCKIYTLYKEGYQSTYVEEKVIEGKIYDIIELTPIAQDNPILKIELEIERNTKRLRSWNTFEHNGTKYIYLITEFEENLALDDSHFNFNPENYEGIEVIDMR